MCGTLKLEGQAKKVGNLIPIWTNNRGNFSAVWGGFIREDKLWWWSQETSLTPAKCIVSGFIEGKFEFELPKDNNGPAYIQGVIVERPVKLNHKLVAAAGVFKILTRPARSEFEKKIHERWPICRTHVGSSEVVIFGEANVRNQHDQMRLL